MATKKPAEAEADAPVKTLYKVREGFVLHPRDGGEPVEGGELIDLTDEEAAYYAAQIELADEAKIAEALAAEAAAAKAAAEAAK